jgi:hypothetical protein
MAPPHSGASDSGPSTAAATKLRDEALAAAKTLEEEAASLESTDTKHSKQLMEEAALLKFAVAAQERVRAAAAALELERAQADTLELKAVTLRDRLRSPNPGDATSLDDDHSFSDAAAVARLHNQAAAVQNIRNLVSLVLDLQSSDYSKWRGHILLILGRFSLQDHVLSDTAHPNDPAWSRMDYVVVSWIFDTISPDLLDVTTFLLAPHGSASSSSSSTTANPVPCSSMPSSALSSRAPSPSTTTAVR